MNARAGFFVLFAALFTLMFSIPLHSSGKTLSLQSLFDKGVQAYESGDYTDARNSFQKALEEGRHWKLYYNLGNTCYKLKDYLQAKIYYLKARKFHPASPDIRHNLEIVNRHFTDPVEPPESDFLHRVIRRITSLFPLRFLSFLLLLFALLLNLMVFRLVRGSGRRWVYYAIGFFLLLFLITLGFTIHRSHHLARSGTGVITCNEATLRSGPGENNTTLYTVHPGLTVRILKENGQWYYVGAGETINGWVQRDCVSRI